MGSEVKRGLEGAKAAVREMWEPPAFFETLGVRYTGPFDGHDIPALEAALGNAASFNGPIVVHVLTEKGRGYQPAEDHDESRLHDTGLFDPAIGPSATAKKTPEYKAAFVDALLAAGEQHPELVALTAAMPGSTGVLAFGERFPDRAFDVGIAEQHMLTMAAGLAMGGARPVVAVYSTFLTRAFDQLMYDVGLHEQPVILCIDRAGITGPDGASHHGVHDMAMMMRVPGATVFAPSSFQELPVMFETALGLTDGPVSIRWPKGAAPQVAPDEVGRGLEARRIDEGHDLCIIAVGRMVAPARIAVDSLREQGLSASLWDPRVVKPLDPALLRHAAQHPVVLTVEDGVREGGVGDRVADELRRRPGRTPDVTVMGTPTEFLPFGDPEVILSELGLDASGIAAEAVKAVRRRQA
jgi:1-deoxy-D-xylulose-5-phosphate synthase